MNTNLSLRLLYLCLALCLAAACGRGGKSVSPRLVQAEAVMFERPDSALSLLRSMPVPADRENHALWCLLVTQAQYKQMLPIRSDSLIRIAYRYYHPTDSARRKAMAALYMGGVNYDLGNVEEAMNYYLEAKTEMIKTTDYKLGYLVMSELGKLYLYRDLSDYALDACRKAYDYAVKDSCVRYEVASLQDLGRVYHIRNDFNQAICYYTKALDICDSLQLNKQFYIIKNELAGVYSTMGQPNKALNLEKEIMAYTPSPHVYYALGTNYFHTQQYDSAHYYFTKALETDDVYTRQAAYVGLFYVSHQPKYQKYMAMYCDSLRFYEDSIAALDKSKAIIAYKEKYDHQKLITENQQLELEKATTDRLFLWAVVTILILLILLCYIYFHRKILFHRREEELKQLTLRLNENEITIDKNTGYILNLETQITEKSEEVYQLKEQQEILNTLREENERLHQENKSLTEQMDRRLVSSHNLLEIKRITDLLRRSKQQEEKLFTCLVQIHPFLSALHKNPVYLDCEGLQTLYTLSDTLFNSFNARLLQAVPSLSKSEVTLCCLIKLHFSVSEIAALLAISPASVSTNKTRTKNKIFAELGIKAEKRSLDVWIWEF